MGKVGNHPFCLQEEWFLPLPGREPQGHIARCGSPGPAGAVSANEMDCLLRPDKNTRLYHL